MTFRDLLEANEKEIFRGSKDKVQKIMDKIQQWNEDNNYVYQELSSYTNDYKTYMIVVDDAKEYKKYQKTIEKFFK